jgi:Fe-S-cluster-containing dehydrogenase component/CRP-like cAMP-binding protein
MPQEHKSRREVLNAINSIGSMRELLDTHDDHFDHEIDLEVVVYGRNYNGKKVGPYVRLLTYQPGEEVVREGDWGGNTFYIVTKGTVDVFTDAGARSAKIAELQQGAQFGEMSVLAGVPRNATVKVAHNTPATILEVQRPALRLLRKLTSFGESLDRSYRTHGKNVALQELKETGALSADLIEQLKTISVYRVYSKNHVLFFKGASMDRLYIVKEGWVRRSIDKTSAAEAREDRLGRGVCFGVEGILKNQVWHYTATLMGRSELLEVSIEKLRMNVALRGSLAQELGKFSAAPLGDDGHESAAAKKTVAAQAALIETGLSDATNLLVMDMDLCVRCGNCSLACHRVHGRSRLLRRGIHITRLRHPSPKRVQSMLAPQVCMHCQDPECLTGCPTGAIGRFGAGQIDINPSTCIGCGDCATQCPYDAISMVGRGKAPVQAVRRFADKVRDLMRLAADPLPPAVEQTDDLLAVKCNLCAGTGLNPPDAKAPAYSCEENCPTGALARINPRTYFTEIKQIEGLLLTDQNHAIGRNIHKSDPPKRVIHGIGLLLLLVATGAAIFGLQRHGLGGYIIGFLNMRWITGIAGLIGVVGVMTYPVRRQMYRRRAGPLRYWMLAHSYLGTLAAILLVLHGGSNSGGGLTTALMLSFDLTILTGLFGVFAYWAAPRLLTKIEETPLLIDDLRTRRDELNKEIVALEGSRSAALREAVAKKVLPRFMSLGYLLAQYSARKSLDALVADAKTEFEPLADSLDEESDRRKLYHAVEVAATLRRVDALIYLHRLLKLWLPPHVIFTSLMLALMVVHIVQVVYFA